MVHAHLPLQAGKRRTLKVNPSNHQKSLIYNIALTMTKNIGNELFSQKSQNDNCFKRTTTVIDRNKVYHSEKSVAV